VRRPLGRGEYGDEPYLAWNAFISILAMSDYDDLSAVQRIAHLAFWYDHEVQNGGHLQYFENRKLRHINETLEALRILGADCQHDVLTRAVRKRKLLPKEVIHTVAEFVRVARREEYRTEDTDYYACSPPLVAELLEKYLDNHFDEFIILI
jgi:hypothetical protein